MGVVVDLHNKMLYNIVIRLDEGDDIDGYGFW